MVLKNTTRDVGAAENVGKRSILATELEGNSSEQLWVVITGACEIRKPYSLVFGESFKLSWKDKPLQSM